MTKNTGLTLGLLGAAAYFFYIFGSMFSLVAITIYVLVVEDNPWLKHCVLKACVLACVFSGMEMIIGLIPEGFAVLNSLLDILNTSPIEYSSIYNITNTCVKIVTFTEKVLFLMLGMKALQHQTIAIGKVDAMLLKYAPVSTQKM